MEKNVDTLIVIPNDKLLEVAPDLPLHTAFKVADEILTNSVKGISELVTKAGLVNLDFADIRTAFKAIEDQIDHRCLNDVPGLENPTSENLARWLWQKLLPALPSLSKVVVRETCTSGCVYRGELAS